MGWRTILDGFGSLLFPHLCLNCHRTIERRTDLLCLACGTAMPESDSLLRPDNALTDRLVGRVPLVFGAYAYVFREGTVCQSLIHALKYHDRPDVGSGLARRFGTRLAGQAALQDLDAIIPVPIHPRRLRKRGYNQAEKIAEGLAAALGVPVRARALRRKAFQGSQTRRGKLERLENVRHSFAAGTGDFSGKHVLLVDDVLTTGATVDFCADALLGAHPGIRLSVVTLAAAER